MLDFDNMLDKLGDAIARDDMHNAKRIIDHIDGHYRFTVTLSKRLPEYNDYCAYVHRETSPRRTR